MLLRWFNVQERSGYDGGRGKKSSLHYHHHQILQGIIMPSHRSASASSDDEEEPPESLSLYDSRRDIEKRADTLKQFQAAEKEKKRARNRERDRRLKEQAQHSRKRRKAPYESGGDLEVRMTRAMEEAEAELDGHGGHDTEQREDGEEIESDQASTGSDDEEESDAEHEAELHIHSTGEVEVNKPQVSKTPHHLPEHLFASAFSSQAVQSTSPLGKRKAAEETSKRLVKKRARNAGAPKDTVVGRVYFCSEIILLFSLNTESLSQFQNYPDFGPRPTSLWGWHYSFLQSQKIH